MSDPAVSQVVKKERKSKAYFVQSIHVRQVHDHKQEIHEDFALQRATMWGSHTFK